MHTLPEGDVRDVVATDVVGVRIGVSARVTVSGTKEQQHGAAGRNGRAVALEILCHPTCHMGTRRLEPQCLVDRAVQQRAVLMDFAALVGVFGEHLGQPADQPSGGFVARTGDHLGVVQHLFAGQLSVHPVLVVEFDVEQCGHQVVGRVLRTPFDVVGVDPAVGNGVGVGDLEWRSRFGTQVGIIGVANRDLFGLRDSQQHADHSHGHHRRQLGNDVESRRPDQRVQATDAVAPDLVLDFGHPARREHSRHQPSQHRVFGRVLKHHDAAGHIELRLDQLENVAAAVRERLPVGQPALDVGMP